ncbi:hypothetical protein Pmani_037253 [Petrolisthes manimaculis]|uniref:Uncharacterized protein n=1 Tax=Petrolisthes manimaculis TaxID=1843537 RepID=A0AAE1NIH9_9EUCA|nr:hypothetical protein Pmani_037253 [Petrolisthes manimaculis]
MRGALLLLCLMLGTLAFVEVNGRRTRDNLDHNKDEDENDYGTLRGRDDAGDDDEEEDDDEYDDEDEDEDDEEEEEEEEGTGGGDVGNSRIAQHVPAQPDAHQEAEQPVLPVGAGVRTPPCTTSQQCSNEEGECKVGCEAYEEERGTGLCSYACKKCCAPKQATCTKYTSECQGGECKEYCEGNEKEVYGACAGRNCKCCIRSDCWVKPICREKGGSCKARCRKAEKEVPNGCEGKDCVCCMPSTEVCIPLSKCSNANGICKKAECDPATEYELVDGCDKKWRPFCKCCIKKEETCQYSPTCVTRGGSCKLKCDSRERTKRNLCYGNNCVCCLPRSCKRNEKCKRWGGKCRTKKCDYSQKRVRGGCFGSKNGKKCRCCTSVDEKTAAEILLDNDYLDSAAYVDESFYEDSYVYVDK